MQSGNRSADRGRVESIRQMASELEVAPAHHPSTAQQALGFDCVGEVEVVILRVRRQAHQQRRADQKGDQQRREVRQYFRSAIPHGNPKLWSLRYPPASAETSNN